MPSLTQLDRLKELKSIGDTQAASRAAPATHADLVEGIIASQTREFPRSASRRRRSGRSLLLAPALVVIAVVLVIAVPGALSGGDSAVQPQSAQAEIMHRITAALARRPGTIVLQVAKVHLLPGGFGRNINFTYESVTETSSSGHQERTLMTSSGQRRGFMEATDRNLMEIYDPTRATIYATTVSAWQSVVLKGLPKGVHANSTFDASPTPGRTSIPEQELREHLYRLDSKTTVEGRPVLKLLPVLQRPKGSHGAEILPTIYVSPSNYHPVREVLPTPRSAQLGPAMVTNWVRYSVLPATRANQRLVVLTAMHPHSRIVRGARAYIDAQRRANKI